MTFNIGLSNTNLNRNNVSFGEAKFYEDPDKSKTEIIQEYLDNHYADTKLGKEMLAHLKKRDEQSDFELSTGMHKDILNKHLGIKKKPKNKSSENPPSAQKHQSLPPQPRHPVRKLGFSIK